MLLGDLINRNKRGWLCGFDGTDNKFIRNFDWVIEGKRLLGKRDCKLNTINP